jgi:hypothetical protein
MPNMSLFEENAAKIFDAAQDASSAGLTPSDMSILISRDGGIHMVAGSDWPLESLQAHHGAPMAYRVSQQGGAVRVTGRAGSRTCLFEAEKPNGVARHLLGGPIAYTLMNSVPLLQ